MGRSGMLPPVIFYVPERTSVMGKNAWMPGIGSVAFTGDDPAVFRVTSLFTDISMTRLIPSAPLSVPDTLFFCGKSVDDRPLLEMSLSLPVSYLVLGGRWPRALAPSLRSKAKENGIRILGPGSEGIVTPAAHDAARGNTVLLADGGDLLVHTLAAFRRRNVPVRYALSFGRGIDYSPLEAADSILQKDDEAEFYVFILERLLEGRVFLDFAAHAAEKGKRTCLLLLRRSETSIREEAAALNQYGVVLLSTIAEIVDGAVAFLSGGGMNLTCGKVYSHRRAREELSLLLRKEAEHTGFVPAERTDEAPLSLEILTETDSVASVLKMKQSNEDRRHALFFTSLEENSPVEELAFSANVPYIPGFRRCFEALRLVFEREPAFRPNPLSGTLPPKCPLHPRPTEYDAKVLLRAYGIPVAREALCHSLAEALTAAESIGYPVALKVMSPSILRKTEARVIALDVQNEEELKNAYGRTLEKARIADPSARIRGVLVQEMVRGGAEWRMEYRKDLRFGPVVEASISGIYGEILPDGVLRAAPFRKEEALRMIRESRGYPLLLEGWRRDALDIEAFSEALAAFSRLAYCEQDISRLDVNPVFVNRRGVLVVDAFIERRVRRK